MEENKTREQEFAAEQPATNENPKEPPEEKPKDAGFRRRMIALAVLVGLLVLVFIVRLVQFQLVNGEDYLNQAQGRPAQVSTSLAE